MGRYLLVWAISVAAAGVTMPAIAAGLDGTAPIICATSETFDCAPDSECIEDSPEAVNLPRFIQLDLAMKKAFTTRLSGEERVAEIGSQRVEAGRLILQGVQNGHGWSMTVSQETGAMTLTASGDQVGFVVFGHCIEAPR